jgi:hypothetical protein
MGYFRFRRRIKIAPGVHWNIGKKGSSVSFGGRGVTYTVGPQGSRTTVGIPGTGVSYTHVQPHSPPTPPATASPPTTPAPNPPSIQIQKQSKPSKMFYILGTILLGIWIIGKLQYANKSNVKPATPYNTYSPSPNYSPTFFPRAIPRNTYPYNTYSPTPNYSPTVFPRAIPIEPNAPPPSLSTTPLEATYRVVNDLPGGTLNLREGPGSAYRLLVKIKAGTGGIRISESRSNGSTLWRKIWVGPYTGWVNQDYLEAENPTP